MFNYFLGYSPTPNKTILLDKLDNFHSSLEEIILLKKDFYPHVNNENYLKFGPLKDCKSMFITTDIQPNKTLGKNFIFEINPFVKERMPYTLKLYENIFEKLNLTNNKKGRSYITILPSKKNILLHSDTSVNYFKQIHRYQFYYTGNTDMLKLVGDIQYPIEEGMLYFFDHLQKHEYKNNSNIDLVLMVFDVYI